MQVLLIASFDQQYFTAGRHPDAIPFCWPNEFGPTMGNYLHVRGEVAFYLDYHRRHV
jgi:hypothetical protein